MKTPSKIESLHEVDRIEIVSLIDNYVDILLRSNDMVTRPFLRDGDEISRDTIIAEHGLSLLVNVKSEEESYSILFDTGHTEIGVPHNLKKLNIDIGNIEAIVLSHGHLDHTGALYPIIKSLSKSITLIVHPGAFYFPRFIEWPDGRIDRFPKTLVREDLINLGVKILESKSPTFIANDMILVTGEIERKTSFEKGFPFAKIIQDGKLVQDPILDDQSLIINLKGKGLVVISGCAHSGIVNTLLYAKKITGIENIHAVIGGFHLTGKIFEPIIDDTIKSIKQLNPNIIIPMHCTGWKAIQRFADAFPDAFILNSVGSRFELNS